MTFRLYYKFGPIIACNDLNIDSETICRWSLVNNDWYSATVTTSAYLYSHRVTHGNANDAVIEKKNIFLFPRIQKIGLNERKCSSEIGYFNDLVKMKLSAILSILGYFLSSSSYNEWVNVFF